MALPTAAPVRPVSGRARATSRLARSQAKRPREAKSLESRSMRFSIKILAESRTSSVLARMDPHHSLFVMSLRTLDAYLYSPIRPFLFVPSAEEDGGGRSTGLVPRSSRSFTASSVPRSSFSSSISRSTLASTSLRDSVPVAVELVLVSVVSSLVEYRGEGPRPTCTTGSAGPA